jgi:hypothetical protein
MEELDRGLESQLIAPLRGYNDAHLGAENAFRRDITVNLKEADLSDTWPDLRGRRYPSLALTFHQYGVFCFHAEGVEPRESRQQQTLLYFKEKKNFPKNNQSDVRRIYGIIQVRSHKKKNSNYCITKTGKSKNGKKFSVGKNSHGK